MASRAPSLAASFIYVFVFSAWTFYISLSNSSLLPTYEALAAGELHFNQQAIGGTILLQLDAGSHLLGHQRGLDAVEEPLQPADELRLGDAELGLARRLLLGERPRDPAQLLGQVRGEPLGQLAHGDVVDLAHPRPAGLVEGGEARLLEQLPDHRADPHHLGRARHRLGLLLLAGGTDHHHAGRALLGLPWLLWLLWLL